MTDDQEKTQQYEIWFELTTNGRTYEARELYTARSASLAMLKIEEEYGNMLNDVDEVAQVD